MRWHYSVAEASRFSIGIALIVQSFADLELHTRKKQKKDRPSCAQRDIQNAIITAVRTNDPGAAFQAYDKAVAEGAFSANTHFSIPPAVLRQACADSASILIHHTLFLSLLPPAALCRACASSASKLTHHTLFPVFTPSSR